EDQLPLLAVDRLDAAFALAVAHHAEDGVGPLLENADDAGDDGAVGAGKARQHAVAAAGCRACPAARRRQDDARWRALPVGRGGEKVAVALALADLQHHDFGKVSGAFEPAARALDGAFLGQFLQHRFQRNAGRTGYAEVARDLALAGFARVFGDESEDLLARRCGRGRGWFRLRPRGFSAFGRFQMMSSSGAGRLVMPAGARVVFAYVGIFARICTKMPRRRFFVERQCCYSAPASL